MEASVRPNSLCSEDLKLMLAVWQRVFPVVLQRTTGITACSSPRTQPSFFQSGRYTMPKDKATVTHMDSTQIVTSITTNWPMTTQEVQTIRSEVSEEVTQLQGPF